MRCLRLKCAALAVQLASKLALRSLATSFRSTLHTAERLVAASEGGTRDVAVCNSVSRGVSDLRARVPGVFAPFWAQKGDKRF